MITEEILKQLESQAHREPYHSNPNFPPSLYYRFLKVLVEYIKAEIVVELGVCGGGSCLYMAMGGAKHVIGVDIVNDYPNNIGYIEEAYPNFKFIIADSIQSSRQVYENYGEVDLLFIDTTHTYEQTYKEYNSYRPFMSDNGIICMDDLDRPGMMRVFNDIPGKKALLRSLHNESGFGVIY